MAKKATAELPTSIQVYLPAKLQKSLRRSLATEEDGSRETISSFVRKAVFRECQRRKAQR